MLVWQLRAVLARCSKHLFVLTDFRFLADISGIRCTQSGNDIKVPFFSAFSVY